MNFAARRVKSLVAWKRPTITFRSFLRRKGCSNSSDRGVLVVRRRLLAEEKKEEVEVLGL